MSEEVKMAAEQEAQAEQATQAEQQQPEGQPEPQSLEEAMFGAEPEAAEAAPEQEQPEAAPAENTEAADKPAEDKPAAEQPTEPAQDADLHEPEGLGEKASARFRELANQVKEYRAKDAYYQQMDETVQEFQFLYK